MPGRSPCSLLEKLCEVCSRTPYLLTQAKLLGFVAGSPFLSWVRTVEFGLFGITGGCFRWPLSSLAQDLLCMKQEGNSVLICHVPSLSLLLSTMRREFKILWLQGPGSSTWISRQLHIFLLGQSKFRSPTPADGPSLIRISFGSAPSPSFSPAISLPCFKHSAWCFWVLFTASVPKKI